jgi:hypothetical protein
MFALLTRRVLGAGMAGVVIAAAPAALVFLSAGPAAATDVGTEATFRAAFANSAVDQRGVARPQFAGCDIGSVEVTPELPGPPGLGRTRPGGTRGCRDRGAAIHRVTTSTPRGDQAGGSSVSRARDP